MRYAILLWMEISAKEWRTFLKNLQDVFFYHWIAVKLYVLNPFNIEVANENGRFEDDVNFFINHFSAS
jgi:hypothetical protein